MNLKHYAVVRVSFDIQGWIENEPEEWGSAMPEGAQEIGIETDYDYYMVAEWEDDLDNYMIHAGDKVFESWADAAVRARDLEAKYYIEKHKKQ